MNVLSAVSIDGEHIFDEKDLQSLFIFGNLACIAVEIGYLLVAVRKGVSFRRNYEQYLDNIQDQLQDLAKNKTRHFEESIQRFLPKEGEVRKSCNYSNYSNALSKTFNIPAISLKNFSLDSLLQKAVGEKFALNHKIVVLENGPDKIKLALAEPTKYFMDELRKTIPPTKKVEFYLADPAEVRLCFGKYYNPFSINTFK